MPKLAPVVRDERGNMIVAMSVVMIITLLAATVMARTISAMASVRQNQDFAASLAQADAGLSDALFRLDQLGVNTVTSFCVGSSPKCSPTAVPGAPASQYNAVATAANPNLVTVTSMGNINNRPHAIRATVGRLARYPFAIFGDTSVTFNGNGSGTIIPTLANGSIDPNGQANVGSDGVITCNGGGQEGNLQVSFNDSWNGCPAPVAGTGTYHPLDPVAASSCPSPNTNHPPVACVPPAASVCPAGNTFPASGTTISGTYYCTGSVTFSNAAPITVAGSFQLYIIPSSGTANVEFSGTDINTGGDPTKFGVYLAGAGTVDFGNGSHAATITGVIEAPSATVTSNGCKMDLTGSLVVGNYTCNGGPNLEVNYDDRLATLAGQWSVSSYQEIPSAQFVSGSGL